MNIVKKLPHELFREIIAPYTYRVQPKALLSDIVHVQSSMKKVIEIYKKRTWWNDPNLMNMKPSIWKGILMDLQTYIYPTCTYFIGPSNIWERLPYMTTNLSQDFSQKPYKRWVSYIWGLLLINEREQYIQLVQKSQGRLTLY